MTKSFEDVALYYEETIKANSASTSFEVDLLIAALKEFHLQEKRDLIEKMPDGIIRHEVSEGIEFGFSTTESELRNEVKEFKQSELKKLEDE